MKRRLLDVLRCTVCSSPYAAVVYEAGEDHIECGYLACDCQAAVIPILDGFVFFTEPVRSAERADRQSLHSLGRALFGSAEDFARLEQVKRSRRVVEPYAAFQPFNESGRAVEPLMPQLTASLQCGDYVLDVWCRTGWTGEWLAGRLPQQHVIALWPGNASVLGYRGFRHLLGTGRRAGNLDIVFTDCALALPFADRSMAMLHGLDVLHRMPLDEFSRECLRVTSDHGSLVFPHVHLSNGEPEPYFERGGRLTHGREYRKWLDGLELAPHRRGWVCSEDHLFALSSSDANISAVEDDPDTPHYNGLVMIAPDGSPAHSAEGTDSEWRYLVNPLFRFDLSRRTARVGDEALLGEAGKLLVRHPVYRARLPDADVQLDETEWLLLVLAAAGLDRARLLNLGGESSALHVDTLNRLSSQELIRPARVGESAHRLQRYHANQPTIDAAPGLQNVVAALADNEAPMVFALHGDVLTCDDVYEIVCRTPEALRSCGVEPGHWLGIDSSAPWMIYVGIGAAAAGVHVRFAAGNSETQVRLRLEVGDAADRFLIALQGAERGLPSALDGRGLVTVAAGDGTVSAPIGSLVMGMTTLADPWEARHRTLTGEGGTFDILNAIAALSRTRYI